MRCMVGKREDSGGPKKEGEGLSGRNPIATASSRSRTFRGAASSTTNDNSGSGDRWGIWVGQG